MLSVQVPAEYARSSRLDHPRSRHAKESDITDGLDVWLASLVEPANLDDTISALARVTDVDEAAIVRAEAARLLADCDERLGSYRRAHGAAAPSEVVGTWIAEARGERLAAERDLADIAPAEPLTEAEVRALVLALGDMVRRPKKANPELRAKVYADLGVQITYDPDLREVVATLSPGAWGTARVGGRTWPNATRETVFDLAA
jgi:hypothetical protein